MASSSTYSPPCAACKFLRRKCTSGCIFAPYFPPEEPHKFANVHKIFGASNVAKLLKELSPNHRDDAVNSLAYEAEARVRDPVYGCVGAITFLQRHIERLQKELDAANDLIRFACNQFPTSGIMPPPAVAAQAIVPIGRNISVGDERGVARFYQTRGVQVQYPSSLSDIHNNPNGGGLDGNYN